MQHANEGGSSHSQQTCDETESDSTSCKEVSRKIR